MNERSNVPTYEGQEPFLLVWAIETDAPIRLTICELLAQAGYRICFMEQGKYVTETINQKLQACSGMVAVYSEDAMSNHHFRKVLTSAVLQHKRIVAITVGDATLSKGMEIQLGDGPRMTYAEGLNMSKLLEGQFSEAKGRENPAVRVTWRTPSSCQKIEEKEPPKWSVSVLVDQPISQHIQTVIEPVKKAEPKGRPVAKGYSGTVLMEEERNKKGTWAEHGETVFIQEYAPKLILLSTGEIFSGKSGVTVVGRTDMCDIALQLPGVSNPHLKLISVPQAHGSINYVEDCGSRNGTWLNGVRLKENDSVQLEEDAAFLRLGPQYICYVVFGESTMMFDEGGQFVALQCIETGELCRMKDDQVLGRSAVWPGKAMDEVHISWEHARLCCEGELVSLTDIGSSNGTFVNEKRIAVNEPLALCNGDRIRMGERHFLTIIKKMISKRK